MPTGCGFRQTLPCLDTDSRLPRYRDPARLVVGKESKQHTVPKGLSTPFRKFPNVVFDQAASW